jgi:uncharacterized membrane protein SpoIIM required for sporulation
MKQMLPYTILAFWIFVLSIVLGYILAVSDPQTANQLTQDFKTTQADPLAAMPAYEQFGMIFINNSWIGLMMIIIGVLIAATSIHISNPFVCASIGAVSSIIVYLLDPTSSIGEAITSGLFVTMILYLLHYAAYYFKDVCSFGSLLLLGYNGYALGNFSYSIIQHTGFWIFIIGTTIHGIFELSAIFLSGGVGLYVSWLVAHNLVTNYKRLFMDTVGFYLFRVLPIFLVAAIVETFITRAIVMAIQ